MKKLLILFFSYLILITTAIAEIGFWEKEIAYNHLNEINTQWQYHKEYAPKQLMTFSADKDQIAFHVDLVIQFLKANEPASVSKRTLKKRSELLDSLK